MFLFILLASFDNWWVFTKVPKTSRRNAITLQKTCNNYRKQLITKVISHGKATLQMKWIKKVSITVDQRIQLYRFFYKYMMNCIYRVMNYMIQICMWNVHSLSLSLAREVFLSVTFLSFSACNLQILGYMLYKKIKHNSVKQTDL